MAPIGEVYFPPLDRCLSGKGQILSWELAFVELSESEDVSQAKILKDFLTDPQTIHYLSNPFAPYASPSPGSKSKFDTKTSAVNVTPSKNARYDIKEIQEDALWLSKTVTIDELSALRIVILEWQTRSARCLLRATPLKDPTNPLQSLVADPQSMTYTELLRSKAKASDKSEQRRTRHEALLQIYMSESTNLLKTCEYIVSGAICQTSVDTTHAASPTQQRSTTWLSDLGALIISSWRADGQDLSATKNPAVISTLVEELRSRIQDLSQGCRWGEIEGTSGDIATLWADRQIVEMIHILRIELFLLMSTKRRVASDDVLSWLRLMNDVGLFEEFGELIQSLQQPYDLPLQSLAVLMSLAILEISSTLETLSETSASGVLPTDSNDGTPYSLSPIAISEINDIIINLASLKVASPIVLAWSIISQTIREMALAAKESKETRQSLRATDRYGTADSSEIDALDRNIPRGTPPFRRRSSNSSDNSLQMTLIEEIYDAISVTAVDEDPINYLALNAVQNDNVFDVITTIASDYCTPFGFEHDGIPAESMRAVLLEVVRAAVDFLVYQPFLISAITAVLTGFESFWEVLDSPVAISDSRPSALFIRDPSLRHKILLRAASRFPYESLPFFQICRALGFQYTNSNGDPSVPWANLEELDTFTCKVPDNFTGLTPIREDEEGDYIQLTDPLRVIVGTRDTDLLGGAAESYQMSERSLESPATVEIPNGTSGVIQSETKPFIIGWNYHYSGLNYIGKILQGALATNASSNAGHSLISSSVVSEAIYLLNSLLASAIKDPWAKKDDSKTLESAQAILGQASDGLAPNQDIISVVLQLFENELYSVQQASPDDMSIDILAHCVEFIYVLLRLMPDRVWPFLGRSGLIGIHKDESQFGYILSQEMALGRYRFLLGYIRLYSALIEDCVSNSASRRAPPKALVRFGSAEKTGAGLSERTMQLVLLCFTRSLIDVLESSSNWKYLIPSDRMEINFHVCNAFEMIVIYCYSIDDSHDVRAKLTSPLALAAEELIETFLSTSRNDFTVKPLLDLFYMAVNLRPSTLTTRKDRNLPKQTTSALSLVTTLIESNVLLKRSTSKLEEELFSAAPVLAKIYTIHQRYRLPVVRLFDAMLRSAARSKSQPPSLLGYLGHEESNYFLDILTQLDQPLQNQALSEAIWGLLSTIMSSRQQWFAMFVLTGTTPRETLKKEDLAKDARPLEQREPIFNITLDDLANMDRCGHGKALAMLSFVAVSTDYWPRALRSIQTHPSFLKTISDFVARPEASTFMSYEKSITTTPKYIMTQLLAVIAKILATYTYYTQQLDDLKFARALVPQLDYLIMFGIGPSDYNNSLQSKLRYNFKEKFPTCDINDFKKTGLRQSALGDSFYFDLRLADKMLGYDPAWLGRNGQGFAEEFRRVNVNFSVVETEIQLFHSWKSLLLELTKPLAGEPKFQEIMANAIVACLRTNSNNTLPQAVFERLALSRADLAFTLLQRLVEVGSSLKQGEGILETAWSSVLAHSDSLELAFTGPEADSYRQLQKILFLALQLNFTSIGRPLKGVGTNHENIGNQSSPSQSSSLLYLIYRILSKGVAEGFRSLTTLLHTSPHLVQASDLSLMVAILRSCLQYPGLERDSSRLLTAFSHSQTAQCAATLLSWSDKLAATTSNDPVLGELSIAFLVELSTETSLAESLAVEGVLSQILSTNVIRALQSRAFGHLDTPRRMYTIWARGILPLLLNLLNAIGPPIASEITAALNLFSHQLSRASNAFAANPRPTSSSQDYITLTMAIEAHNLALITSILNVFREAGASAAVQVRDMEEVKWDYNQVLEDVEGWLQARAALRSKLMATSKKEESWARIKPSKNESLSESLLEEKIVEELHSITGILARPSDA